MEAPFVVAEPPSAVIEQRLSAAQVLRICSAFDGNSQVVFFTNANVESLHPFDEGVAGGEDISVAGSSGGFCVSLGCELVVGTDIGEEEGSSLGSCVGGRGGKERGGSDVSLSGDGVV